MQGTQVLAAAALLTTLACTVPEAGALSTTETCDTGAAAATLSGNGEIRSPDGNYNPAGCFRGFKVDINQYRPGPLGALAAYASAAPKSAAQCATTRLQTIIWKRNADGSRTLLADNTSKGSWIKAALGGERCATPSLDLTTFLGKKMLPGGNYRVVMQARIEGPNAGLADDTFQKVLLSVPAAPADVTAAAAVRSATALRKELSSSGTTVSPITRALYDVRRLPLSRAALCRSYDLQLQAFRIHAVALKQLVSADSAGLVDRRVASGQKIRDILCGPGAASDLMALQSAMIDDLGWAADMQAALQKSLGVTGDQAADLIANSYMIALERLASRCGTVPADVTAYVFFARAPAGVSGAELLQGSCKGRPTQIALGTGLSANPDDRRASFRACMDAQLKAAQTDRCSGPISSASSSPDGSNPQQQPPPDCGAKLVWNAKDKICEPPDATDEVRKQLIQENREYEESTRRAEGHMEIAKIHAAAAGGFGLLTVGLVATGVGIPAALATTGRITVGEMYMSGVFALISQYQQSSARRNVDAICDLTYDQDPRCTGRNKTNRCVEFDLVGDKAWYQTAPTPSFPEGREMTQNDVFQDCSCKLFERDYSALPGDFRFGGPVGWCDQTAEEKKKLECLRNPEDPKDAPKADCIKLLEPKGIDRDTMLARWCRDKMPNCTGAYIEDTGKCGCPTGTPGVAASGPPRCANVSGAIDCGPDSLFNEKTCSCSPLDAGLGCQKGGLAGYLTKSPNDAFVATFPKQPAFANRNFLMVAPGRTALVTPELKAPGLKDLTQLKLVVKLPETTAATGYRGWNARLFCSNPGANIQNRALASVPFDNLKPGLNTVTVSVPPSQMMACANNDATPARFEILSEVPAGQPRIGFEDITVTNRLLTVPGRAPITDPCHAPTPPVTAPRPGPRPAPVAQLLPRTNTAWTFSDGTALRDVIRR